MTRKGTIAETDLNSYTDYSLQLNRWILKPIGVWPAFSTTTKLERIVSVVLNVICYGCMVSVSFVSLLQLLLEEEASYTKLKIAAALTHWFTSSFTYTTLLLRSKDIQFCVRHMDSDWRTVRRKRDQEVMLENAKFGRYVATFCAAIMQGGILSAVFVIVQTMEEIQVGNETRIVHVLITPVYKKLVNVDESPMNEIVLAVQILSVFVANSSTVGTFSLAAVLAAHACGQLGVLMLRINESMNASRNQKEAVKSKELRLIVEHHLRTLNFVLYTEEVMNQMYFLELFRCVLDICLIGYLSLADLAENNIESAVTLFTCVLAICFNVFIMCYIGETLTEQCKKVGEVVYMTNWYYLPDKVILDLILIIVRSNVVIDITAGKFVHLSIYTFGQVIKTSFAYLNVLRQMM
ncbi:uncharacterized protein LOC143429290 [Xylocopa sonorina]|uniref:uncharacterized protein LOC143429290 n=1 Tax=Xylocopa sonorina TaxID=1818115 RepID=UPI00403A9780